ncbi:post-GPI attachment to proteins factor 2 isoform X1 [Synchiropus splendidus]|uniref:post-GPI attachment to proteins factor 2 isoform X1 n=1 Tax=Synchiropus splendidus TaxID=270530 RepID=UPI00237EC246|nr:post-GPI attachment to proteins factor 2 isoform X1 [Synchiropus splendidus]
MVLVTSMLQGPYGSLDRDRHLVRLPITGFAVGTVLLPLGGLLVCLFISLMYHFEEATYTHCKVTNYLPSISAAISRVPERYIWRCCIGLHSAPRFLMSAVYFNFYRSHFGTKLVELGLCVLVLICSLVENSGLLLLTYVSSTETYVVHKNGFIAFIASSLLHMLGTCRLWQVIQRFHINSEEVTSYRWKVRLFIFNVACCLAAAYFFRRHNKFCEGGFYTLFALCEYLVVFSNMAFHMTAFWDFRSEEVTSGDSFGRLAAASHLARGGTAHSPPERSISTLKRAAFLSGD